MTYGIYSVYDLLTRIYSQPFYQTNDNVAKRAFALTINNPEAKELYPIRDDLELWCIGYFDDKSGMIIYDPIGKNDKMGLPAKYPCRIVSRGEAVIQQKKEEESNDDL